MYIRLGLFARQRERVVDVVESPRFRSSRNNVGGGSGGIRKKLYVIGGDEADFPVKRPF